jgi:hypothetical protein
MPRPKKDDGIDPMVLRLQVLEILLNSPNPPHSYQKAMLATAAIVHYLETGTILGLENGTPEHVEAVAGAARARLS